MSASYDQPELGIELKDFVATVEIQRPPHNFFDFELIRQIAAALAALDDDLACRAVVLCASGAAFCAGARFNPREEAEGERGSLDASGLRNLYGEAAKIFSCKKPIVAAVQGPAIGGGLGLAMAADFRVACPEARFAANFTRLGFHPGFGLTVTLPRAIGVQNANLLFLTSRRVKGEEALAMGLADKLVPAAELRGAAWSLAREIAENAPLGVMETRASLRGDLAEQVRKATDHELAVQMRLRETEDFVEGVRAVSAREVPNFKGC